MALARAVHLLETGGVVAHALEGVWGLACDPFDAGAVARVLRIKQRPVSKGLIVVAASPAPFAEELGDLSPTVRDAVLASWPGATTWVVPNHSFPAWITGGAPTVAIRVPAHAQARALAERFGGALVSTSANLSGWPPARSELVVRRHFGRTVDWVLPGATAGRRGPSRIRVAGSGAELR
ncbi:MAG: tRNA threonylcarbamoyladenosine biosynthesis protein RimN [Gammaproteobacteria bacterium]|nr:tRNA threonylcarbamoyladenosine biosynthesis protein RimN [Gammaproteobacteria bacterium]